MGTHLQGSRLGWAIATVGAVAFILQGYDQGLMNGIITLQSFVKQFPQLNTAGTSDTSAAATLQGTVVAIYEVGSAIGSLSCFVIGDVLGRRKTIFAAAVIILVGVLLQSTPFQLGQLIAARVITGVGVGIFSATIPVWVAECSKAQNRGKLVMMEGWFAIGGVFLVTWIELGFYFVQRSSVGWRFPIAFQSVFAVFVMSVLFSLPESPRWLVSREREDEAAGVLSRLADLPADSEAVQQDLSLIRNALLDENEQGSPNPFAMTQDRQLYRTLLALSINMLAQMTGVNLIAFYSNIIFQSTLGFSPLLSRVISGCLQTWQVIFAGVGVLLVDRFGRRPLLLTCSLAMAVAHAGLAALTKFEENRAAAGASLLFDFVALAAFPVGLFLVPFLYTAEIAPLRVRAKVAAMGSSINWAFNFLLAEVTPAGFETIGWKYYLVYFCTSMLCFVVVYLFAPETKGMSLEDINGVFVDSQSALDPVRVARKKYAASNLGAVALPESKSPGA